MYFFNQFSEGNVLLYRMHSLLILVFVFFNLVAFVLEEAFHLELIYGQQSLYYISYMH